MPTPNFEDAPDGSSSVNHTGSVFSEEAHCFWEDIDPWAGIDPYPPTETNSSAPPLPPPQTATEVNDERMRAMAQREDALLRRRTATEELRDALSIPRGLRRGDGRSEVVKKDPNAWSLREAVELCKLLEVVVPEAGFHIALTGGLLYKEGRRKDCDLMFYQIRQVEPNYEVLWKYLTVAGVLRSPSYPENGWLVKATYRGKAVDCLFPNAKKVKKVVGKESAPAPNQNAYQTSPPTTPPTPDMEPPMTMADCAAFLRAEREAERVTGIVDPTAEARARMAAPALVRHNDGAPEVVTPVIYRRTPYSPWSLLTTPAPAPIPAAAEAQDDIPF